MDSDQVDVNVSEKSGFGPGFQDARSWPFRAEYSAVLVAIVAYLVWRTFYFGGVDWLQVIFWVVFPDLVSFVAIGASLKRREWPTWGADFYNLFHTILTVGACLRRNLGSLQCCLLASVRVAGPYHDGSSRWIHAS
jgi:hypothetical protein